MFCLRTQRRHANQGSNSECSSPKSDAPITERQFYHQIFKTRIVEYYQNIIILVLERSVVFLLKDKTQVTMLIMWLIELYLNNLGQLKEAGEVSAGKHEHLKEEFRKFLAQTKVKVKG